jgi:hypothetical protein
MLVHLLAKSGEAAKSGPIGIAVILLLCIGCYFLFKSMSKHLRKVREEFPGEESSGAPPAEASNAAKPGTSATPSAEPPSGQRPPEPPAE